MNQIKVLIVDDAPGLSQVLAEEFTKQGAVVRVAGSCVDGVVAIKDFTPDIAIVDVLMPQGSGFDLIRVVQKSGGNIPFFVLLTDSLSTEFVADAMECGITTYLQKADHDPANIVKIVFERFAASHQPQ